MELRKLTDKELKMFITNLINEKVNENENFIRYTFYELRVKYNLTEKEVDETLRMSRNYFENKDYDVYFTNAKYRYNNEEKIVKSNESIVAIKNQY